jgi:hypothetical protein
MVKMEKDSQESKSYYPIKGVDLIADAQWLTEKLLQTKLNVTETGKD